MALLKWRSLYAVESFLGEEEAWDVFKTRSVRRTKTFLFFSFYFFFPFMLVILCSSLGILPHVMPFLKDHLYRHLHSAVIALPRHFPLCPAGGIALPCLAANLKDTCKKLTDLPGGSTVQVGVLLQFKANPKFIGRGKEIK